MNNNCHLCHKTTVVSTHSKCYICHGVGRTKMYTIDGDFAYGHTCHNCNGTGYKFSHMVKCITCLHTKNNEISKL